MVRNGTICSVGIIGMLASPAANAVSAAPESAGRAPAETSMKKPIRAKGAQARPGAPGRNFRTLDEYLAYLRQYAAPIDRPWYREVRPDLFKLETGNLRADLPPRYFTRAELEQRFGFPRR